MPDRLAVAELVCPVRGRAAGTITGRDTADSPLLQIEDLQIHYQTARGVARVVDGANLTVGRNEIFGLAGESGCGKTTLVEAILQIVRFPNRIAHGRVLSEGTPDDLRQQTGCENLEDAFVAMVGLEEQH